MDELQAFVGTLPDDGLANSIFGEPAPLVSQKDLQRAAILGKGNDDPQLIEGRLGTQLADQTRVAEAQRVLSTGKADMRTATEIQTIAKAMNTTDETAADFQLLQMVSANDKEAPLIPSLADLRKRRQQNLSYAVAAAGVAKGAIEGKKANQGVMGALKVIPEFFETLIIPDFYTTIGNVLSTVDPQFGLVDRANVSGAIKKLREYVATAPQEESNKVVKKIINEIESRKGTFLDNDLQAVDMIDTIFGNFKDGDVGISDNVFAALEYISAIPVAGSVVKAGSRAIKIGMNIATPAGTVATSNGGVSMLGKLFNDPNAANKLAAAGTSQAQVVGNLALPKMGKNLTDDLPFIEDIFIPESQRLSVKSDVETAIRSAFQPRIKDSVIELQDTGGGFDYLLALGKANGRGFANAQTAEKYAKSIAGLPDYKVEQIGGEFFVNVKGRYNWDLNDVGAVQDADVKGAGMLKAWLGKSVAFGQRIIESGTVAALNSVKAERAMQDTLKPFTNLGGSEKGRVMELLDQNEGVKKLTRAEMTAAGLSEKGIKAMESVYAAADLTLAIKNQTTRLKLVSDGYREAKVAGETVLLKPAKSVSGKVVDESGKVVKKFDQTTHNIFQLLDDVNGARYVAVAKNAAFTLGDLPKMILKPIQGYLPRLYRAPVYIREVLPDGSTRAVMTAPTEKRAAAHVEAMVATDPNKKFTVVRASETSDAARDLDDLAQLREQGMIYSQKRKPNLLNDVDGGSKLVSVMERIQAMQSSAATSAGIGRWGMVMAKQWDAKYGDKFGTFNFAQAPVLRDMADEKVWKEAKALHDHIRLVTGTHEGQFAGVTRLMRNTIADFLQERGLSFLAGEVSGLTSKTLRTAKDLTFAAYLGLNPLRQLLVQTTMIPTYLGINGAAKYALTGKYFRDFSILTADLSGGANVLVDSAKKLGMDVKEAELLVKQFRDSGMLGLADNHIFSIGTFSDSRVAQAGPIAEKFGQLVQFAKNQGFDRAVRTDKRAAFLISRNRYLEETGKKAADLTREELQKIASFAEQMALNQNRSDTLASQNGILSLFTQFMSHQIKMSGRLMGLEKGFTSAEKVRMGVITALTYGTAGFGANELVEYAIERSGAEVDEETKSVIRDGINGHILNTIAQAFDEVGSEKSLVASGEKLSPSSSFIMGVTPDNVMKIVNGTMSLGQAFWNAVPLFDPASAGFIGGLGDAVKFSAMLAGQTTVDSDEKALALGTEVLRKFPITNNFMKGYLALKLGYGVDSKGNPIVEKAKGEAIAQILFGLTSVKEADVMKAMMDRFGEFEASDSSGLERRLKEAATEDARSFYLPLINSVADGHNKMEYALNVLSERNALFRRGLSEIEYQQYIGVVLTELDKSGILKSEALLNNIAQGIGNPNGYRLGEDLIARVGTYSFNGAKELQQTLREMLDESNSFDEKVYGK